MDKTGRTPPEFFSEEQSIRMHALFIAAEVLGGSANMGQLLVTANWIVRGETDEDLLQDWVNGGEPEDAEDNA